MHRFGIAMGLALMVAGCDEGLDPAGDEISPSIEQAVLEDGFEDPDSEETEPSRSWRAFVGVPDNYVYDPSRGSLHDYCTNSPDEFPAPTGSNAKFQGPCARHDLCYGSGTDKRECDDQLLKDMRDNCNHEYGALNPYRLLCYDTAHVYWLAVIAAS